MEYSKGNRNLPRNRRRYVFKKSNPNQPITVEEIRKEALEVCEAGAANVHVHVRDDVYGNNVLDVKKFHQVIDPIREKYPDISVCGCVVPGGPDDWNGMEQVFKDGLFDQTPINTQACFMGDVAAVKPPHVMLKKAEMCLKYDVKVQLAVYSDGDIDNARRYLIDSGMLPKPYYWVLLPGILGCSPMYSPTDMFDVLLSYVRRIREIDSESQIMVVSGGRASSYLTAAAMLLGLHVRVGKEDTIWKYPHSDELIESNVEIYKNTVAMARLLGREPATIDQCVEMFGLKRRAGKIIK